jgi:hypothetical protein
MWHTLTPSSSKRYSALAFGSSGRSMPSIAATASTMTPSAIATGSATASSAFSTRGEPAIIAALECAASSAELVTTASACSRTGSSPASSGV